MSHTVRILHNTNDKNLVGFPDIPEINFNFMIAIKISRLAFHIFQIHLDNVVLIYKARYTKNARNKQ